MSVKTAVAKLSMIAAGGAVIGGGAVHYAEKPRPAVVHSTKGKKYARPVKVVHRKPVKRIEKAFPAIAQPEPVPAPIPLPAPAPVPEVAASSAPAPVIYGGSGGGGWGGGGFFGGFFGGSGGGGGSVVVTISSTTSGGSSSTSCRTRASVRGPTAHGVPTRCVE